jgi:hypothetical protein
MLAEGERPNPVLVVGDLLNRLNSRQRRRGENLVHVKR